MAVYTITLSSGSGAITSGVSTLYVNAVNVGGSVYQDCYSSYSNPTYENRITKITPPTWCNESKVFDGYYDTDGERRINPSGSIMAASWGSVISSSGVRVQSNGTWTAQWTSLCPSATILNVGGTVGIDYLFFNSVDGKWYHDYPFSREFSESNPIAIPSMERKRFAGGYSTSGIKFINADGTPTAAFLALVPTGDVSIYTDWEDAPNAVVLKHSALTPGVGTIFLYEGSWYSDGEYVNAITHVPVPTKTGYTFDGYFSGGTEYISSSGEILNALADDINSVQTVIASFTANVYTLSFDANGGTASFYTKNVTFGQPIGPLPTARLSGRELNSWKIGDVSIKSTTVWEYAESRVAKAEWKSGFSNLNDWFDAEGNTLMLTESDSGETRRVTNLWNGTYEQGSNLPNPVCTYKVKSSGNVSFTLGHCYGDFFLVGVEYRTKADAEPTLVLRGMANEGQNAIKTYAVSFAVDPDHIAQDPMGAVSGGGELVECNTTFACDPAVVYEGSEPVASDICHRRVGVSAMTGAYFMEAAPTCANNFIEKSVSEVGRDIDFNVYNLNAERSL